MQTNSVGSSWFIDMMNHHANIYIQGEYPLQHQSVESMCTFLNNHHKKKVHGFKVKIPVLEGMHHDAGKWLHKNRLHDFIDCIKSIENIHVLLLYRENWIKHSISRVKQQDFHFKMCRTWTPTKAIVQKRKCAPSNVNISIPTLRLELGHTKKSLDTLFQTFTNLKPYLLNRIKLLSYEEMQKNNSFTTIQKWLNLTPMTLTSNIAKMTNNHLKKAIGNFNEIEQLISYMFYRNSSEYKLLFQ